ncbi:MAG: hypothetical protein ACYS7Y_35805 [Planctomycetota bacterium]|jgi:hypothetical protein
MPRANETVLDELHALQAETLLAEIRRLKESNETIPPALFAQVNKFLKDNGVDRAITPGDPSDLLDEEAPVFDNVVEGDFT